jgi:hypothetical protein
MKISGDGVSREGREEGEGKQVPSLRTPDPPHGFSGNVESS